VDLRSWSPSGTALRSQSPGPMKRHGGLQPVQHEGIPSFHNQASKGGPRASGRSMSPRLILLAACVVGLAGCGTPSSAPSDEQVESPSSGSTSVESTAADDTLDTDEIMVGLEEMTEISEGMGRVSTLAAEACLQEDQSKLDDLKRQASELLSRAEAVPDGGSNNMVIARTAAQRGLRLATEGLQTCDPATWMEVVGQMENAAVAIGDVGIEAEEAGN